MFEFLSLCVFVSSEIYAFTTWIVSCACYLYVCSETSPHICAAKRAHPSADLFFKELSLPVAFLRTIALVSLKVSQPVVCVKSALFTSSFKVSSAFIIMSLPQQLRDQR